MLQVCHWSSQQSVLLQTENQFVVSDTKSDSCQRLCKNIHLLLASIKRELRKTCHIIGFLHIVSCQIMVKIHSSDTVCTLFLYFVLLS